MEGKGRGGEPKPEEEKEKETVLVQAVKEHKREGWMKNKKKKNKMEGKRKGGKPEPEGEKGKEMVLVQTVQAAFISDIYLVPMKGGEMVKLAAPLLNDGAYAAVVTLGSVIYTIGGSTSVDGDVPKLVDFGVSTKKKEVDLGVDLHYHSGNSVLDLSTMINTEEQNYQRPKWKAAPVMKYCRRFPECASLGGKIYALGGSASCICVGEVFDPETGCWEIMDPPKSVPLGPDCVSSPVFPDPKRCRLLVHFRNVSALYAYYPAMKNWDCLHDNFRGWFDAATLVDDVIYFHVQKQFENGCIEAYDLVTKEWLEVVWTSLFHWGVYDSEFMALLHLGNNLLCLVNYLPLIDIHPPKTVFQFVKFRIKRASPTKVLITPGRINCYEVDGSFEVNQFVPL